VPSGARCRRCVPSRRLFSWPSMTLLADVVSASREVTGTSSRSEKVAILAGLLGRLDADEIAAVVGFLAGVPRQGRVGIGYSTIYGVDGPPAAHASLTVGELDHAIEEVQGMKGSGSAALRRQVLGELLGRATEQEADFVKRLFTGGLRQGALGGLMVDAVAKAAGVPARTRAAR
jgi:DNA ligase 1